MFEKLNPFKKSGAEGAKVNLAELAVKKSGAEGAKVNLAELAVKKAEQNDEYRDRVDACTSRDELIAIVE